MTKPLTLRCGTRSPSCERDPRSAVEGPARRQRRGGRARAAAGRGGRGLGGRGRHTTLRLGTTGRSGTTSRPAATRRAGRQPWGGVRSRAAIGVLGGMIGLGGAEFRLALLVGLFGCLALQAVILNKARSLIEVIAALPARFLVVLGRRPPR